MFKLQEVYEYDWPVTVRVPVDGGRFRPQKFTARFRMLDQDRAEELVEKGTGAVDRALLEEVWIGWGEDVQSEDGEALEYSDETRAKMLQKPFIRIALTKAYYDSISGIKAKN